MLDKTSDAQLVREWLTTALERGKDRGLTAAALAEKCKVSAQAVNGWKKTGRITKTNLQRAIAFFGYGPSFDGATLKVAEPRASYSAWPFRSVARSSWDALSDEDKQHIEDIVEREIAHLEKRAHQPTRRKTAT